LDDVGNLEDSADFLNRSISKEEKKGVDEPDPRHWQKLGLAAPFPT